jgi:hypothetical protein
MSIGWKHSSDLIELRFIKFRLISRSVTVYTTGARKSERIAHAVATLCQSGHDRGARARAGALGRLLASGSIRDSKERACQCLGTPQSGRRSRCCQCASHREAGPGFPLGALRLSGSSIMEHRALFLIGW